MKKLTLLVSIVLSASVLAQSPQWASTVLVQRHNTVAVEQARVFAIPVTPKFSFDVNLLGGYNVSTPSAALGGSLSHTWWNKTNNYGGTVGLGATYNVSQGFSLKDINSNSLGLILGVAIKL